MFHWFNWLPLLFNPTAFEAHGVHFIRYPNLMLFLIISNLFIVLAYYSIPILLIIFVYKRQDIPFKWIFFMFSAFIFLCGTHHVVHIITYFFGLYPLEAIIDFLTGVVSIITAAVLWYILPLALKIPKREQLATQSALSAIVESSEDAVIGKTLDGIVTSWNKSAERIYGYTAQEMIGNSINKIAPPDRHDEIPAILERIRKGEHIAHFETVRMKKNRSLVTISLSISPIKNTLDEIVGAAAIERDMTERKKLQEAEDKLKVVEALQELNKELESFSYSVSHDLRAPLRAIDGFSKILTEDYSEKLDDNGKHIIATIRSSTQQMGALIDDLLSFSRIGRQEIKTTNVDMTALAKTVFDELKQMNPQHSIQFICADLPIAHVDPTLMHQVWMNLLSNAIKFTQKKEDAVITIGSKIEKDTNIYYVKDNGAGFDMKYVEKLFGVFQRLHSAQDFEGTGIGLSIVQRIIKKHGGKVWAEGIVDQEATFYFSLPKSLPLK
ncbi:MAG TPA: PAS domain S-box protein [Candidatus Sulfotelmatobacter sp.]|jgi:PAS domain S-box-containing protein|nr:PAS domain S-box protein [Candidatus Sulfotelmatobacter sp.]